jgi:IS30 family transposase
MIKKPIRLNCPEAYHIEWLYRQGYGCRLIADMIDRDQSWLERSLRNARGAGRLAKFVGRLSNGKRPASQLKRSWAK